MAKQKLKSIQVPPLSDAMYRAALKNAKLDQPFDVVAVRYDRKADTLDLYLRKGVIVCLPRLDIRELANLDASRIRKIEVQPGGDGISFKSLNIDIYVPGLLADELGPIFAKAMGESDRKVAQVSRKQHRRARTAVRAVAQEKLLRRNLNHCDR